MFYFISSYLYKRIFVQYMHFDKEQSGTEQTAYQIENYVAELIMPTYKELIVQKKQKRDQNNLSLKS